MQIEIRYICLFCVVPFQTAPCFKNYHTLKYSVCKKHQVIMYHMLYKNVSRNIFMSQNLSALQVFNDWCIHWKGHTSLHCVCVTAIQANSGDALASFKMYTAWNASNSGTIDRLTMLVPRRLVWSGWDWLEGKCCYEEVDSVWKIFDHTACKTYVCKGW